MHVSMAILALGHVLPLITVLELVGSFEKGKDYLAYHINKMFGVLVDVDFTARDYHYFNWDVWLEFAELGQDAFGQRVAGLESGAYCLIEGSHVAYMIAVKDEIQCRFFECSSVERG